MMKIVPQNTRKYFAVSPMPNQMTANRDHRRRRQKAQELNDRIGQIAEELQPTRTNRPSVMAKATPLMQPMNTRDRLSEDVS